MLNFKKNFYDNALDPHCGTGRGATPIPNPTQPPPVITLQNP